MFILYLSQLISFHCLTFGQKLYNKTVNDYINDIDPRIPILIEANFEVLDMM